tara:strand:- start:783 stop:929 length:147 start_codon:yes stop_codon:yes gene_type:complete
MAHPRGFEPLTSDLCLRRAALYPAEPDIARISGGFDAAIINKNLRNVH